MLQLPRNLNATISHAILPLEKRFSTVALAPNANKIITVSPHSVKMAYAQRKAFWSIKIHLLLSQAACHLHIAIQHLTTTHTTIMSLIAITVLEITPLITTLDTVAMPRFAIRPAYSSGY